MLPAPIPRPMTAPRVHETAHALLRALLPPPARVLELGAGEGAFSRRLADDGYGVLAVDQKADRFRPRDVPFQVADVAAPLCPIGPLAAPRPFDACVALELIEHLWDPRGF